MHVRRSMARGVEGKIKFRPPQCNLQYPRRRTYFPNMKYFTLPPSGNSVSLQRLLGRNTSGFPSRSFAAALSARCGVSADRILPAASGATALYVALRGLSTLEPRRKAVAVPAWCCPSVPQAIIKAGLEPILVDLDPSTLGYDAAALRAARSNGLLAVILVHFFGLPQPLPAGDWEGTAFLRDCAQDFDHRPADGIPCFYSFGRGKALNVGHGGALCIPEGGPLLRACIHALAALPESSANPRPMALAINLFSQPRLYWAVSRMPGLRLGRTEWTPFEPERISPNFEGIGLASLEAYASCRGFYRRLNGAYRTLFAACDGDWVTTPLPGQEAGLPARFPVLVRDPRLRETLVGELGRKFGGVTRMYPTVLGELPGAPEGISRGTGFPGARRIAREILTLPLTAKMLGVESAFLLCLAEILDRAGALRSRPKPASRPVAAVKPDSRASEAADSMDWTAVPAPQAEDEEILARD